MSKCVSPARSARVLGLGPHGVDDEPTAVAARVGRLWKGSLTASALRDVGNIVRGVLSERVDDGYSASSVTDQMLAEWGTSSFPGEASFYYASSCTPPGLSYLAPWWTQREATSKRRQQRSPLTAGVDEQAHIRASLSSSKFASMSVVKDKPYLWRVEFENGLRGWAKLWGHDRSHAWKTTHMDGETGYILQGHNRLVGKSEQGRYEALSYWVHRLLDLEPSVTVVVPKRV